MKAFHSEAEFDQEVVSKELFVVVVDLMRAGILPAHTAFNFLHSVLPSNQIRQDHILLNRVIDNKDKVTGTRISGHKIGGGVNNAFIFIPDPMGATGGSVARVMELYESEFLKKGEKLKKFVALHFIVTPEYLRRLSAQRDRLEIFALRLDRGLSPPDVLQRIPGERWEEERGLNDKDYIVPGAGGIGELLNNSFV